MRCTIGAMFSHPDLLLALGAGYTALSLLTFLVYAYDKAAARAGRRRVPERQLLVLGLLGGWPGGWLAQQLLRHKSAKPTFLWRFWISVGLHLMALGLGWRWLAG
ncbi:DUF1294 domain-containing protein [Massilia sp. TS11]|uniref:DUF1294 domain-containing protein n=1 Tax=Massilia sp. TS11 TaxID=2908003 RepID=UPI001EDBC377|nr:DUF1294 domain-containing protein [Massilia sp. TS11]MCG2585684.1 DUF1294 domain-containing protein [Massilia sp. TS11]